jgi:CRISPR-associated protein Cas2
MAISATRTWLISYDIADPKRLVRVHRYLKSRAIPVQYSVFVTRASVGQIGDIRSALASLIDPKLDDVRIYQVPEKPQLVSLGCKTLPEGIQVLEGKEPAVLASFTSGPAGAKLLWGRSGVCHEPSS